MLSTAPSVIANQVEKPVRVLHVLESWRPVVSGYTTRSWQIVAAQAQSATIVPSVLVTSRQHVYGEFTVEQLDGLAQPMRLLAPTQNEQLRRRLQRFYLDGRRLENEIVRFGQECNAEVLHGHWSSGIGRATARAANRLNVPFVAEVRFDLAGAIMSETVRLQLPLVEQYLRRRLERHLTAAAEVVSASHTLRVLINTLPTCQTRTVTTVTNAVDGKLFSPGPPDAQLRQQLGLTDAFVVGSTSNMLRYEGLDLLIHAASRARQTVRNLALLFIGGGPQFKNLERLAARLQVPVVFVGRVPYADVPSYLRQLDLFAIPRRSATITRYASPIKAIEALSCGRPIVASDVGDLRQMLTTGAGSLVPPGNVDRLAEAICDIAANSGARCAMVGHARRIAESQLNWQGVVDVYCEVYRRVRPSSMRAYQTHG